eukprot:CAMPEP_0113645294 /NCGR_PEP_ID=MMETSP0017_2-20120614/23867_1 /TAXON_ID=2856 /ORGANISM="Cylindrotheca closterium" /LENGTH=238 /DNA_ID=CAMNT_0000557007 /DNA_START=77 /DNA_END=790 /DNA_ORIENTATION=- /assembly_acc=CAM_ASM_000147
MKISLLLLSAFCAAPITTAFTSTLSDTTNMLGKLHKTSSSSSSSSALNIAGVQEAWTAYNDALEASPLLVKSVTASVILGAADVTGQALEQAQLTEDDEKSDLDIARTIRFAFFGLVLQAPWNHFYYTLLDGAIPPTEEPFTPTTGIKVVIDQFVQAPIFTVLIFGFLGFLEGKNTEAIKKQLDDDYADTMVANWKLWVPATVVNLAFVPPILRVLYLNCVFFFWSIFLSLKLNNKDE